jgi:hypothetical protein
MAAEPSGRYLYVTSNFNFTAADDNIIAVAVDPTTGALSQIGSPIPNSAGDAVRERCRSSPQFAHYLTNSINR